MHTSDVNTQTIEAIQNRRKELGDQLVILTHHYQRRSIIELGDFKGDSFDLSQKAAASVAARFIIFCGVHFMAESAAILALPTQTVQIPHFEAGCPMADMADIVLVQRAWQDISTVVDPNAVTPLVYMNSDAELKAFCGNRNGAVCTSSNAPAAFKWGFEQGEKILFFPDEHLGRNTGNRLGISQDEIIVWDPDQPMGGHQMEDIEQAKIIVWKGYCHVHTHFKPQDVENMRTQYPDAQIIVHPECPREIVDLADDNGSTAFIVNYIKHAAPGSTIIIGTEINLIERMAFEHTDKQILPLRRSLCPNMFKISPENLLDTLNHLGQKNVVKIPTKIKAGAQKALDRMLALVP
jgi:quinolinate synthase